MLCLPSLLAECWFPGDSGPGVLLSTLQNVLLGMGTPLGTSESQDMLHSLCGGPCLPEARSPSFTSSNPPIPAMSPQEFEIELEGSQSLRILCYEKCYDKTKVNKDNNEIVDKIMGKGQIQVSAQGTQKSLGS